MIDFLNYLLERGPRRDGAKTAGVTLIAMAIVIACGPPPVIPSRSYSLLLATVLADALVLGHCVLRGRALSRRGRFYAGMAIGLAVLLARYDVATRHGRTVLEELAAVLAAWISRALPSTAVHDWFLAKPDFVFVALLTIEPVVHGLLFCWIAGSIRRATQRDRAKVEACAPQSSSPQ